MPSIQSRHVLAMLGSRGVYTSRESLVRASDALGLVTQASGGCKRRWTPAQARFLVIAAELHDRRGVRPDVALELAKTTGPSDDPLIPQLRAAYQALFPTAMNVAA